MPKALILIIFAVALTACQTTPEMAELQSNNQALQEQLAQAQRQIEDLQRQEEKLEGQVQELEQLAGVLAVEKSSRVEESSGLRLEVRKFVQQQIDDFKEFLVRGHLLDYVGSELVERGYHERDPVALVDLAHPMPRPGSLTGVTGYFSAPTNLQLKVLRPIDKNYVVIWESPLLTVDNAGESKVQLPVSVGVEPGDVVAYVFPEVTTVTFDKGTGDTRVTRDDLALGDAIKVSSSGAAKDKRAYSLGIYALLD